MATETQVQDRTQAPAEPDWMRERAGELARSEQPRPVTGRVVKEDATATPASAVSFYDFHTPQFGAVAAALSAAQGKLGEIHKNMARKVKSKRSDAQFDLRWATLDVFLDAVRPVLSSEGLALLQLPLIGRNAVTVKTVLLKGEQMVWNYCTSPLEATDAWAVQSATTYAKKNGLSALLGVAAEDDDEGAAAGGNRFADEAPERERPQPAARKSAAAKPDKDASKAPTAKEPEANGGKIDTVQGRIVKMQTKEDPSGHVTALLLDTGLKAWTRDTALALQVENNLDGPLVAVTVRRQDGQVPELVKLEKA